MPANVVDTISARAVAQQHVSASLIRVIKYVDAIYVTRLQRERFQDQSAYRKFSGSYVVDGELMQNAKPSCAVLHPLPRVDEIPASFDTDPRAAYFR